MVVRCQTVPVSVRKAPSHSCGCAAALSRMSPQRMQLSPRKKAAKKVRQIPKQESDGKWRTTAINDYVECERASADEVHVSVSPFGSYIICYIPYCFILDMYGMIGIEIYHKTNY